MSNQLGKKTSHKVGDRDAFHVPVILARSSVNVRPGQRVRFLNGQDVVPIGADLDCHGVIDPFWHGTQPFFVLLRPGAIGPVRHVFDVPFIDDSKPMHDDRRDWDAADLVDRKRELEEREEELMRREKAVLDQYADVCVGCW